jgi:hypothetical protein
MTHSDATESRSDRMGTEGFAPDLVSMQEGVGSSAPGANELSRFGTMGVSAVKSATGMPLH